MGCWDETCALTNTPIRTGQKCVMVLIERADRDRWHGPFGHNYFDYHQVTGIFKGTYNDYGWLRGAKGLDLEVEGCDWNDLDNRPDDKFFIVFFHQNVWDECQKFHAANKEGNWNLSLPDRVAEVDGKLVVKKTIEFAREFAIVCCIATITRRDILGATLFRGCQDYGTTATYDFVQHMTANRLREKKRFEKACEQDA